MKPETLTLADRINAHLKNGGSVVVSNHLSATEYKKRHAGMFSTGSDGNLYVQRGRHKDCLTTCGGTSFLVKIQAYKPL